MSKPFWDKYNFLHDTAKADSNNPLIYSAFWKALTGEQFDYRDYFYGQMIDINTLGNDITIQRHPTNNQPTSLDEIIGGIYLDLITSESLSTFDYRWHDTLHSPSKFRIFQALVYCAGKRRNFFKTANVRDLHPIAYLVLPHIRHYARKKVGRSTYLLGIFFYLWLISVLMKRNFKNAEKQTGAISQKNIAHLVLSDLGSLYWIKLFKRDKNFNDYFEDENHPIRLFIK